MGCASSASASISQSKSLLHTNPVPQCKADHSMEDLNAEHDASKNGRASPLSPAPVQPDPVQTKSTSKHPTDQIINKYLAPEVKEELANMDIDKMQSESEGRVESLQLMADYTGEAPLDDLLYLRAVTGLSIAHKKRVVLADHLSQLGIARIFQQVWAQGFGPDLYCLEKRNVRLNMKFIMIIMWNSTDKSKALCKKCMDDCIYVDILKYLQDPVLDPTNTDVTNMYLIKGLMGILHNIIQLPDLEARDPYRQHGAFEAMQKLNESKNVMVRCKSILLMAYIINEDENELVNSEDSSFVFLIKVLDDALKHTEHQSKKWGYQAVEIVMGLNRLAANDANKQRIVKQGALPYYTKLLQPNCTVNEQMHAARGLWILAFKCQKEIQNSTGCLEALQHLLDTTEDEGVQKQAMGALWILQGKDKEPRDTEQGNQQVQAPRKKKVSGLHLHPEAEQHQHQQHIMISYQWQYKPIMLRVRDHLRDAGFRVWMDVDNMSGSILEAMALAVERAAVVIVCLSQKYKESPSCRTEAEYSFRLRKDIIPLRLQPKYQPDGWLGALSGNKLYFDFSLEDRFNASVEALIKELGERGRSTSNTDEVDFGPVVKADATPMTGNGPPGGHNLTDVYGWKANDVAEWLKNIGLKEQRHWFEGFDGSLLVEYKSMQKEAPEFFYTTLRDDMKFKLLDVLKFTKGLKHL